MATVHWQRDVPEAIRALDTLEHVDYADLFTGTASDDVAMSPEHWMRTMRSAPARVRLVLRLAFFAQRRILGMRLETRPSADHMLGWRIAERGDNWFRLETDGPLGTGHLVFHVAGGRQVSVATFLRYHRRMGALLWAAMWRLHRRVGRTIFDYAATAGALRSVGEVASAGQARSA